MTVRRLFRWIKDYRLSRVFWWQNLMILLLFVVPLAVMTGVIYRFSRDMVEYNIRESAAAGLARFSDAFDSEIAAALNISTHLVLDRDVRSLLTPIPYIRDYSFIDRIRRIQSQIRTFLAASRLFDHVYVYSPFHNFLIKKDSAGRFLDNTEVDWYPASQLLRPSAAIRTIVHQNQPTATAGAFSDPLLFFTYVLTAVAVRDSVIVVAVIEPNTVRGLMNQTIGIADAVLAVEADDQRPSPTGFQTIDGRQVFVAVRDSPQIERRLVLSVPLDWYQTRYATLNQIMFVSIVVSLVFSLALAFLVSVSLFRPMQRVLAMINAPPKQLIEQNSKNALIFRRLFDQSAAHDEAGIEAELRQRFEIFKSAQAVALQAQIRPHFLHNTLDAVNWAVMRLTSGPNQASEMIGLFSKILRLGLRQDAYLVPLTDELEHCRLFVGIQNHRFSDRIGIDFDIDQSAESCLVPKLTLQPIVENAVHHGIRPREHSGSIRVRAYVHLDVLRIDVDDDGVGMDAGQLRALRRSLADDSYLSGVHVGLANVHQRIRVLFGTEYGLTIDSTEHRGTRIAVCIPVVV